jgi:hypothetical protein
MLADFPIQDTHVFRPYFQGFTGTWASRTEVWEPWLAHTRESNRKNMAVPKFHEKNMGVPKIHARIFT